MRKKLIRVKNVKMQLNTNGINKTKQQNKNYFQFEIKLLNN